MPVFSLRSSGFSWGILQSSATFSTEVETNPIGERLAHVKLCKLCVSAHKDMVTNVRADMWVLVVFVWFLGKPGQCTVGREPNKPLQHNTLTHV